MNAILPSISLPLNPLPQSAKQVAPDGCSPLTTRGADESVGLIHGWLQ